MSQTAEREDDATVEARPPRTILGHPIGLANLLGVELWERFSFYGMVTILPYYLYYSLDEGGLGIPQPAALGFVGAYAGLVYLSTMLGSWLADRVLGMERMVFYGGFVVMLGHVALALLPGFGGVSTGLVLVAIGAGALKANASSLLGTLYARDDRRTDSGFSIFYLGITVGSFFGPLLTGLLNDSRGFHFAFGAAAVGMLLGLAQYVAFRRNLGTAGKAPGNPLPRTAITRTVVFAVASASVVAAALLTGVVNLSNLAQVLSIVVSLAAVVYFVVILTSPKVTKDERSRVRAFIPMFLSITVFAALFTQMFTAFAAYSDERIDWNIFGWTAPSSWLFLAETVWVMPLLAMASAIWVRLGDRAPSTPTKLGVGIMLSGICFLLFLPFAGGTGRTTPALYVFLILLILAVAEVLVAPIGLAVTTKLAPQAFRAQLMALYFIASALGSSLSGVIGSFYHSTSEFAYFLAIGLAGLAAGGLMFAFGPWIRRHLGRVR